MFDSWLSVHTIAEDWNILHMVEVLDNLGLKGQSNIWSLNAVAPGKSMGAHVNLK